MLKSIRSRVFTFLSLLVLVSLVGVGVSFWITQRVNQSLSEINNRAVPLQKNLIQLGSDTDILRREMERSLGFSHWNDMRWKPKRIPLWTLAVHRTTLQKIKERDLTSQAWQAWYKRLNQLNQSLGRDAEELFLQLQAQNIDRASELYPEWLKQIDMLQREVEWAKKEIDRETLSAFKAAQTSVGDLRFALQLLLVVVISVAMMMIWMGERALRPVETLRRVIQQVTQRGALTSQEKAHLPQVSLYHHDEVSELAREFHGMATSLIEREKMIEFQKSRLEEQNKLLTQMGELQKRLQQAEHLAGVGRLSAQVAHEVGNPLHSIGLEAELALDVVSKFSDSKTVDSSGSIISIKSSLGSILKSVERLQKIIQNYLRLSKLSPEQKISVDLKEVIETVLATYSNSIQKLKVQVDWEFSPEAALVVGDPDLLEYALGNLLQNSLQALESSPENFLKKIRVRLRADSERVLMRFEDNGPGISDEVQKDLFKPFFTTKAQGTGLGLSFIKKVFTDLGGDFYLKYSRVGEGTAFEGFLLSAKVELKSEPKVEPKSEQLKQKEAITHENTLSG